MGFRENLKAQLQYADMLVKELAVRTGIKKPTLDSYLRSNGYSPSVEAAVKIAEALDVSVEYLVLGSETKRPPEAAGFPPELGHILAIAAQLGKKDRQRLLELAKMLKNIADQGSG